MTRGQHWEERKKKTVDSQLSISVKKLREWGYLSSHSISGTIRWSRRDGWEIASIGIFVSFDGAKEGVMLLDSLYNKTERLSYEVKLETTRCHFGGIRWWFICPLSRDGIPCGRRVGVLYVVGKYAGCRHCYNLTYKSCQDSHKFDRVAFSNGLDPRTFSRYINRLRT